MFAQGGRCFFCCKPLARKDASVEHLVARTHGGPDNDENCVACCKSLNALFGRVSLKEKLRILLNQQGAFRCPAESEQAAAPVAPATGARSEVAGKPVDTPVQQPAPATHQVAVVVADLYKRGNARPRTVEKLRNTIRCRLAHSGEAADAADGVLELLKARDWVRIDAEKVTYSLPPLR